MTDYFREGSPPEDPKIPTVDPRVYYGSQRWLQEVLSQISGRKSMELLGLPGIGKTSLLRFLSSPDGVLTAEKYRSLLTPPLDQQPHAIFFVLVEFKLIPVDKQVFVFIYERFQAEYQKYRGRMLKEFDERELELPDFPAETIDNESAALEKLSSQLEALSMIRPIFLFDDFDKVYRHMTESQVTNLQPFPNLSSMVFATSRRLDMVNPATVDSPFYYMLSHVRLSGLLRDEAAVLVTDMARSTSQPLHDDDVDFILEQAGGHPQLLISATKSLLAERQRMTAAAKDKPLSIEHREHLVTILRPEFYRCFNLYWTHLDSIEQAVVMKILRGQKCESKDEKLAIGTLMYRGLVTYEDASKLYKPFSPLFEEFLLGLAQTSAPRRKLELTGTEAGLLEYLRLHPNQTCTFQQLLQDVWNSGDPQSGDRDLQRRRMQVTVTVSRLRSKLKQIDTGEGIINIRDVGYRYVPATS